MAPQVLPSVLPESILSLKTTDRTNGTTHHEVSEDYAGQYRFAPIEEAQVSRAMIKRCEFIVC